jgi:hypothetical protein
VKNGIVRTISENQHRRQVFQDAYKYDLWGGDPKSKFHSGVGSRGSASDEYSEQMASLIGRYAAAIGRPPVIIDLGCGDFQVASALLSRLPDVTYVGCDIVPELIAHNDKLYAADRISFRCIDIVSDPLPAGDICLVRQAFQHLSNKEIRMTLGHIDQLIGFQSCQNIHDEQRTGPVNPDKVTGADVRGADAAWSSTKPRSTRRSPKSSARSPLRTKSSSPNGLSCSNPSFSAKPASIGCRLNTTTYRGAPVGLGPNLCHGQCITL